MRSFPQFARASLCSVCACVFALQEELRRVESAKREEKEIKKEMARIRKEMKEERRQHKEQELRYRDHAATWWWTSQGGSGHGRPPSALSSLSPVRTCEIFTSAHAEISCLTDHIHQLHAPFCPKIEQQNGHVCSCGKIIHLSE